MAKKKVVAYVDDGHVKHGYRHATMTWAGEIIKIYQYPKGGSYWAEVGEDGKHMVRSGPYDTEKEAVKGMCQFLDHLHDCGLAADYGEDDSPLEEHEEEG